jgi:hypothetical protein
MSKYGVMVMGPAGVGKVRRTPVIQNSQFWISSNGATYI